MYISLSLVHRIQFNSEEQWTKALKFLLTNLKWGLAWVSSQFTDETFKIPELNEITVAGIALARAYEK